MSKWRVTILAILTAAPALFLMGYGSYQLWISGLSFWVWWPMMGSLAFAYLLGWYWQKKQKLLQVDLKPQLRWTERDKEAWKLVERRAQAAEKLSPEKMLQITFYAEVAQEMALEMARLYHPRAQDPLGSLTVPEILTAIQLASQDMSELVDKYLPGGHLMTINDWKKASKVPDYYQAGSLVYWAISAFFSPVNTAMRFFASQVGVSRPLAMLQQNLLAWFYTAFLQRMGTYLIDLNSGRLRVGAQRFRELLENSKELEVGSQDAGDRSQESEDRSQRSEVRSQKSESSELQGAVRSFPSQVTIGVIGQVKAGKSSLVNAILGEQRARTHVLPETREITRYDLQLESAAASLQILDTVGYAHTGPREDQMPASQKAAQESDILLLVLHARTAARQPDLIMLQSLRRWFDLRRDLKMPPVIAVLTHIDFLAPAMEWEPPYAWQNPQRFKEQQIADAVGAVREQLGLFLAAVVPVCVAEGRVYGVQEWLIPTLVELLGEGRAVAMLRCLRAEIDAEKIRKVFKQLFAAGKEIATVLMKSR